MSALAAFLAVGGPLIVAVFTWWSTERSRARVEEYQRKEARYVAMLGALHGFYVNTQNKEAKTRFLEQMNMCWLHCPDDVVAAGNAFLDSVATGAGTTEREREGIARAFVLAMRRDLKPDSKLTGADFRFFTPN